MHRDCAIQQLRCAALELEPCSSCAVLAATACRVSEDLLGAGAMGDWALAMTTCGSPAYGVLQGEVRRLCRTCLFLGMTHACCELYGALLRSDKVVAKLAYCLPCLWQLKPWHVGYQVTSCGVRPEPCTQGRMCHAIKPCVLCCIWLCLRFVLNWSDRVLQEEVPGHDHNEHLHAVSCHLEAT